MKHAQLKDTQRAQYEDVIKSIRTTEATTLKALDVWLPVVISAIIAGNHVSLYNKAVKACRGGRREQVYLFGRAFLPHQYDDDAKAFQGKRQGKQYHACVKRFEAFLASGETFSQWCERSTEVKSVERTPAEKFERAAVSAIKNGLSVDDMMAILRKVTEEPAAKAA